MRGRWATPLYQGQAWFVEWRAKIEEMLAQVREMLAHRPRAPPSGEQHRPPCSPSGALTGRRPAGQEGVVFHGAVGHSEMAQAYADSGCSSAPLPLTACGRCARAAGGAERGEAKVLRVSDRDARDGAHQSHQGAGQRVPSSPARSRRPEMI